MSSIRAVRVLCIFSNILYPFLCIWGYLCPHIRVVSPAVHPNCCVPALIDDIRYVYSNVNVENNLPFSSMLRADPESPSLVPVLIKFMHFLQYLYYLYLYYAYCFQCKCGGHQKLSSSSLYYSSQSQ